MKNEITENQLEEAKVQGGIDTLKRLLLSWFIMAIVTVGLHQLDQPKGELVSSTKVVFESPKVVCFTDPSVGTWCVDKTLEDVRMPLLPG